MNTRTASGRPVTLLAALFSVLAPDWVAAQSRPGLPTSEGANLQVTATFSESGGAVTVSLTVVHKLPEDSRATVYFSSAIDFIPLPISDRTPRDSTPTQIEGSFKGGRMTIQLGPWTRLCPGNYVVRVVFTPWNQTQEIQQALERDGSMTMAKGYAVLPYHTRQSREEQLADNLKHVNGFVRDLRTLFIELERSVGTYRAAYQKSGDAEDAKRWYEGWRRRTATLADGEVARAKETGLGDPYGQQNEQLAWLANRLGYYGDRYSVRIVGDETVSAEDQGKGMEDLARADRLPSGMVRTQFFEGLRALSNMTPYEDPNRGEVGKGRPKLLAAFASLVRSYDELRRKAQEPNAKPPAPSEWTGALSGYRKQLAEADEICRNVLIFCPKQSNRRSAVDRGAVDAAAGLQTLRNEIEGLSKVLGDALARGAPREESQAKIDLVIVAAFRPTLTELHQRLQTATQEAEAHFRAATQKENTNRTPFLDALTGIDKKDVPEIRLGLNQLADALKPLDPEARVVRHYVRVVERGRGLCDDIHSFAAAVLAQYQSMIGKNEGHPALAPLYENLRVFETGLTPPREDDQGK